MHAPAQDVDDVFECVVEVVRLRMSIASFEVGKSVEGAAQCAGGVHLVVRAEVIADEREPEGVDDRLDRGFEFRVARARVTIGGGHEAGSVAHGLAPRPAHCADGIVARHSNSGCLEAFGEKLAALEAHAPQQIVVAVDMAVQRGLANAKIPSDSSQGDGVEPFRIGDCASGGHDGLGVELLSNVRIGSCHRPLVREYHGLVRAGFA